MLICILLLKLLFCNKLADSLKGDNDIIVVSKNRIQNTEIIEILNLNSRWVAQYLQWIVLVKFFSDVVKTIQSKLVAVNRFYS